jgi:hypothetical protein
MILGRGEEANDARRIKSMADINSSADFVSRLMMVVVASSTFISRRQRSRGLKFSIEVLLDTSTLIQKAEHSNRCSLTELESLFSSTQKQLFWQLVVSSLIPECDLNISVQDGILPTSEELLIILVKCWRWPSVISQLVKLVNGLAVIL